MGGRRWRPAVAAGLALLVAFAASGCQVAAEPVARADGWTQEFQLAADQAETEEERAALADGEISDQEYSYFQTKILDCLDSIGVDASWSEDGKLIYDPNGVEEEAIDGCYSGHGARLLALRDAIVRNPDHLDQSVILLECLRRVGLVGPEYTVDDLEGGADMEHLQESEDFAGCIADPLHHE